MNNTTDMKHALVKKARSICPCLQGGVDGSDAKHSEDALIPQKIKSAQARLNTQYGPRGRGRAGDRGLDDFYIFYRIQPYLTYMHDVHLTSKLTY